MWPGFDSRTRCQMWVEFVVGSRPCSEREKTMSNCLFFISHTKETAATSRSIQHPIAGFHCHAIKIKIENHSLNEVKKLTRYRP